MNSERRFPWMTNAATTNGPAILLVAVIVLSCLCGSMNLGLVRSAIAAEVEKAKTKETETKTAETEVVETTSPWSITGRAGYIAFPTFGRDDSITHVELLPYLEANQHTVFSDIRFFMSNDGLFGGNVGLGYRYRAPVSDRIFGASFWYDCDDTTGELFHQVGVSLETYGSDWDLRSNLYVPIGDTEQDYGISVQNQRFVGNQIVYDGSRRFGEAMTGFDLEMGLPLPTEFAARHNLTLNYGGYWFFGDSAEDICGVRVRAEGNVTDNVAMQVEMTDDRTFGTNVTLGVAILFPGGARRDGSRCTSNFRSSGEFIRRNYNVIVSQQEDLRTGLTAINPETGQAYVVQHVSSTAGGLNLGTVEDPFQTIADAQAAGGDITFVHAGSVLSEAVVLNSGETLLGEGVDHWISYSQYGNALLPTAASGTVRPTLQGVSGDAVTLASDVTFAGFIVDSATGHGVVGNGVQNVTLTNVDVRNTTLDGVFLQNSSGSNVLTNVNVTDAGGAALHVDGGTADVTLRGTIQNSAGASLVVENTTAGHVDLARATIDDDGGDGVVLTNVQGDVTLGDVNIRNGSATGIAVADSTGTFTFGDVEVENAAGTGIQLNNVAGTVTFDEVTINGASGAVGLSVVDSAADVSLNDLNVTTQNATALYSLNSGVLTIVDGTIASTGGSAVDVENTETDITLASVSSDGATTGIRIVDNPGTFTVTGSGTLGSGGLIQNATTGVLLSNAGTVTLNYVDLNANGIGIEATDTEYLCLNYGRVTNSTTYAIDSLNTKTLDVYNSTFENNGTGGTNTIRARIDTSDDYDYVFLANTFTDDSDAAISIFSTAAAAGSSLSLWIEENEITTTRAGADGINLAFDGAISGVFYNNQFEGSGGSNDGIDIAANSTTELMEFSITGNTFAYDGGNDTGVRVTTLGPSMVSIASNEITFDGSGGVGVDLTLAESAEVYLYDNVITDNVSGGTGIRFSSIAGSAEVNVNSNEIYLLSETSIIDYGIVFASITDTITLNGVKNNVVDGATTSFYAPDGHIDGSIFVNRVAVP